jgi:hypothetical protein
MSKQFLDFFDSLNLRPIWSDSFRQFLKPDFLLNKFPEMFYKKLTQISKELKIKHHSKIYYLTVAPKTCKIQ